MIKPLRSALVLSLLLSLSIQPSYANELLIWDKLNASSAKGYVLLLRHSLAPGVGDPENFKLGDCSTQRNLSQEGRDDASEIGSANVGIIKEESPYKPEKFRLAHNLRG